MDKVYEPENYLREELFFSLPEREQHLLSIMPDEWMISYYSGSLVYRLGANAEHIHNLFLGLNYNEEKGSSYQRLWDYVMYNRKANLNLTAEKHKESAPLRKMVQALGYKRGADFLTEYFNELPHDGMNLYKRYPNSEITVCMGMLKIRHLISDASDVTMDDYNRWTAAVRNAGYVVHPQDDPILGMVEYQKPTYLIK